MVTTGACLPCRLRKVKCVGGPTQRCERCRTQGLVDCVYEGVKKRGTGTTLRMREACKQCRARKRRCDAKRPCATCREANTPDECEYEDIRRRRPSSHNPKFSFRIDPRSREVSAREHLTVGNIARRVPPTTPVGANLEPEKVPPGRALTHYPGHNSQPPEPRPHIPQGVRTRNPLPPYSVLSTLIFPGVLPEPRITLESLGPERFQLFDVVQNELEMKFRLGVVYRLGKLGIRLTPEKQRALLRGDTSGAVIHPFFIPASHSLGMHFCEGMGNMYQPHARYVQSSLEHLAQVNRGNDWELQAQVALWITSGSIIMRLSNITSSYIKRSCDAVNAGGLRFIPVYGPPPELSESVHERLTVLSQIMYFENLLFLTSGGPHPKMAEIETEFRHLLPVTYPLLFKICPLSMRTRSILLVRDTVVLLGIRPADINQLQFWAAACDHLVTDLGNYSRSLLANLQKFREFDDKSGSGVIRDCCINCLAHLAVLCETLSQEMPTQAGLHSLCDWSLEQLSELTKDMVTEEYSRLDLLLGVSWEKVLGVLDTRIAKATPQHGARLRHWREPVAVVYSDFLAKLPDAEPAILAARSHELDGRTEESRYPNMMLPWVKQRYGLL